MTTVVKGRGNLPEIDESHNSAYVVRLENVAALVGLVTGKAMQPNSFRKHHFPPELLELKKEKVQVQGGKSQLVALHGCHLTRLNDPEERDALVAALRQPECLNTLSQTYQGLLGAGVTDLVDFWTTFEGRCAHDPSLLTL